MKSHLKILLLFGLFSRGFGSCPTAVDIPHAATITFSADPPATGATMKITCLDGYLVNGTHSEITVSCVGNTDWIAAGTPLPECLPTRVLDLEALRQMSRDADETQDWWIDFEYHKGSKTSTMIWAMVLVCGFAGLLFLITYNCGQSLITKRILKEEEEQARLLEAMEQQEAEEDAGTSTNNRKKGGNEGTRSGDNGEDGDTVGLSFKPGKTGWNMHVDKFK